MVRERTTRPCRRTNGSTRVARRAARSEGAFTCRSDPRRSTTIRRRTALNLVNDLFLLLHEKYPDYLIEHSGSRRSRFYEALTHPLVCAVRHRRGFLRQRVGVSRGSRRIQVTAHTRTPRRGGNAEAAKIQNPVPHARIDRRRPANIPAALHPMPRSRAEVTAAAPAQGGSRPT